MKSMSILCTQLKPGDFFIYADGESHLVIAVDINPSASTRVITLLHDNGAKSYKINNEMKWQPIKLLVGVDAINV